MRYKSILICFLASFCICSCTATTAKKPTLEPATQNSKKEPKKFAAVCTDITGTVFNFSEISFNFSYSYRAPGNWVPYAPIRTSENNPRYFIPIVVNDLITSIPFTNIQSVTFKPPVNTSKTPISVHILTIEGETIDTALASYGMYYSRRFEGKSSIGQFKIKFDKISHIKFNHEQDENPGIQHLDTDKDYSWKYKKLNPDFIITLNTWNGRQHLLRNACVFKLSDGQKWSTPENSMDLRIGASSTTIAFDKINKISFKESGKLSGQITLTEGSAMGITSMKDYYIGGNTDKWGPAYISIKQIQSMEINK